MDDAENEPENTRSKPVANGAAEGTDSLEAVIAPITSRINRQSPLRTIIEPMLNQLIQIGSYALTPTSITLLIGPIIPPVMLLL